MADWNYGVVIDSGSSGSRVQVYKWEALLGQAEHEASPPKILQDKNWSHKISPGVSSFAGQSHKVWASHYKEIVQFAESTIPAEKHLLTPIFVLSTAGMRLLPSKQRQALLDETCRSIAANSRFIVSPCSSHVQLIDGATEGVYGWIALNYLMGTFNGYDSRTPGGAPASIGFMDMGGASTQIAFMPSLAEEIKRHDEDLSTVVLRNVDGSTQKWRVFVETWLGFGANQARSRYLDNLVALTLRVARTQKHNIILDPCMPKGALLEQYEYNGKQFTIRGIGKYDSCLRDIYPLLMKHFMCYDEPCLFNGKHAPKMNFETDKFVGVSEYWYTANDVFQSGGEYNFHSFNEKVRTFCESSWGDIVQSSVNGEYSGLPESFLREACFKASWVINVLHEGFELPRLDVDIKDTGKATPEMVESEKAHVPFRSADSIEGKELSWTLGKILLEASGRIPGPQGAEPVDFTPSAMMAQMPVANDDDDDGGASVLVYWLVVLLFVLYVVIKYGRRVAGGILGGKHRLIEPLKIAVKNFLASARAKSPLFMQPYMGKLFDYMEMQDQESMNIDMEEGHFVGPVPRSDASFLRTRSSINLGQGLGEDLGEDNRPVAFLNRPFPNLAFHGHRLESRGSAQNLPSSRSISRTRNRD